MTGTFLRRSFSTAAIAAALVVGSVGVTNAQVRAFPTGVSIITQPSQTRKPQFAQAGIIKEVLVKDGDKVKAGQVIMRQDMDLDQKEAERLKVEAESDARIEAARAEKDVRQIEYDRKSQNPGAYNASEIDESKAKLIEAEKSMKVAEEDKQQAKIKHEQQMIRLTKMELKAPDDGPGDWTVQNVGFKAGEMADPQNKDGVIQMVKNNPLYVEIRGLTTLQVASLKKGEKLEVRYINDGEKAEWQAAKIDFITPVADAGADRQLVKLELPNPEDRDAGMRMELKLTDKLKQLAPKDDALTFQAR
jgi:multidrug efflux pump subunit AcrA (membrane-fusion protein)